jgi:hypothetical protein
MQVVTNATDQKPSGLTDRRRDSVRNYRYSLRNNPEERSSADSVELQKTGKVVEMFHKYCRFFFYFFQNTEFLFVSVLSV